MNGVSWWGLALTTVVALAFGVALGVIVVRLITYSARLAVERERERAKRQDRL